MANSDKPIILFTNDDGIRSPGLWAAVAAFRGARTPAGGRPARAAIGHGAQHAALQRGAHLPLRVRQSIARIAAPTP